MCWRRDEQPREDARCEMWDAPRSWLIAPKMHCLHCLHPSAHLQMHCCLWCTAMHPHSKVFLCFKMRERFFIPDTVLVQFCLPSTATHGCIIVAVATNCTSVIPSTLASPLSPQSPLPSLSPVSSLSILSHIILQHSEPCHTLCPIQCYHCHTLCPIKSYHRHTLCPIPSYHCHTSTTF